MQDAAVVLSALLARRSVSPRRLCGPAPAVHEVEAMVQAARRAPDHGALVPWRVLRFRDDDRQALARLFEQEKRRRDPLAPAADLQRAREHALHAPAVLAFIVRPQRAAPVPLHEQWLGAGAALGQLLLAAHLLGYGAIVLSGDRCHDPALCRALGVAEHETLAGFVSLGTVAVPPSPRSRPPLDSVLAVWQPAGGRCDDDDFARASAAGGRDRPPPA